jgi:hypothetical protein
MVPNDSVALSVGEKPASSTIIFKIPRTLLNKIDQLDREGCLSRSEKMRQLLAAGLKAEVNR